jgi:hexulose-6-phosphate isomerase
MQKSINYWAFPGGGGGKKDIGEFLQESKDAGYDAVELCFNESGALGLDSDEGYVRGIAQKAKAIGIDIASVATGMFWQYPMTSDDPQTREKSKEIVRKGLQIAAWAGTDALLVVPGVVASPIGGDTVQYDVAWDRATAGLKELAPEAERLKVSIGLENVWNGFLLSPVEMELFVDNIGSDYVGVYFDVGNVLAFGLPEHWIRVLGDRIVKVHLKDFKVAVGNIN